MKMRYSVSLYILLGCLLPFCHEMAVSSNAPAYTHYIYMFAHANGLHFVLNGIAWAFLWRIITPARTISAYLAAVAISFLLPAITSDTVVGWSVIIYWYWGFILAYMPRNARLRFLTLIVISFFIPGLAAAWHAAMLAIGYLSRKTYDVWQRTER